MSNQQIPVFKPLIEEEEHEAAREVLTLGWLGMGSYVGEFEDALRTYLEASDRFVVAVSTGHAAIHLSLLVMGIGPGDEVISPSFNNAADFQAILATGATPVFCDIDDSTLCIDLDKIEQVITPRTKVIIVMDYDCVLCDHDRIQQLAEQYNLRVLHDAAHSFGSRYKGKMIGSFSDVTVFSFDPVKTITCIDGGAIIVKTKEEAARLHEMRLIGMAQPAEVMYTNSRAWTYDMNAIGFRYHLANLHAAIGLAQLKKMHDISATRNEACCYYNKRLNLIPQVIVPKTDFNDITPFLYYIRVPKSDRDPLREYLKNNGVDTGIHWQPGHTFSLLKNMPRGDLSITEKVGDEILSLPLHSKMSTAMVDRICACIRGYFGEFN